MSNSSRTRRGTALSGNTRSHHINRDRVESGATQHATNEEAQAHWIFHRCTSAVRRYEDEIVYPLTRNALRSRNGMPPLETMAFWEVARVNHMVNMKQARDEITSLLAWNESIDNIRWGVLLPHTDAERRHPLDRMRAADGSLVSQVVREAAYYLSRCRRVDIFNARVLLSVELLMLWLEVRYKNLTSQGFADVGEELEKIDPDSNRAGQQVMHSFHEALVSAPGIVLAVIGQLDALIHPEPGMEVLESREAMRHAGRIENRAPSGSGHPYLSNRHGPALGDITNLMGL